MTTLTLEVTDFVDEARWRWRLSDENGCFLADHEALLDRGATEYEGFVDLYGFVRWNSSPDPSDANDRALTERVAGWVRSEVWGLVGDAILNAAEHEPIVVHVKVPTTAEILLFRPFELGLLLDKAPGSLDVSLVFDLEHDESSPPKRAVGERLRMLALFSMPTDQAALNVRLEQHELRRLVHHIVHAGGRSIELRILQYGVTRELLEEYLEEGEGWDLIHFSGHGLPSGLVLEHQDGSADIVHTDEFTKLLRPARAQIKLVTLSSCESAAATAANTMQMLGLSDIRKLREAEARDDESHDGSPLPAIAQQLASQLGCAVLAMRYPVSDQFAVHLSTEFYEGLLKDRKTLPGALQRALRKTAPSPSAPRADAGLSLATPALFGASALDLKLDPPPIVEPVDFDPSAAKLSYFESEPKRFVGRVGPLARASGAFALKSEKRGILFYGMAGAGKTACALELAYRHQERRFEALAWFRAPSEGQDISRAPGQFAVAMENQLEGLELAHVVDDLDRLALFLPRLRALLSERSLLIVLDNLESLLYDDGKWRDPRWGLLTEALIDHDGLSRLVLTSRTAPMEIRSDSRMQIEPVNSLSATESVLLARQLPNLNRLMSDGGDTGRHMVRRVLELVQGNPKLIELADRQAADPSLLEERIAEATATWVNGANLNAFFATGKPDDEISAEDFLRVIESWTIGITGTLSELDRLAFWLICCLEVTDRIEPIVKGAWINLRSQADDHSELQEAIESIANQGLIDVEKPEGPWTLRIHPAVERAEQRSIDDHFREKVDNKMALMWVGIARQARDEKHAVIASHGGLAAGPYLLRIGKVEIAAYWLSVAITNDPSAQALARALPLLEWAVALATETKAERRARSALLKARAALRVDDVVSELRELFDLALEDEDFQSAVVLSADLFNEFMRTGRLKDAQTTIGSHRGLTQKAGLGPWSEMSDEGLQLRLMKALGEHKEVLAQTERLRERMDATPEESEQPEVVSPANVREVILSTARSAAVALKEWERALTLNEAVCASKHDRGVPALDMAKAKINSYGPLIELERLPEAEEILRSARKTFEAVGDPRSVGQIFSAWATLEVRRNRVGDAIRFEEKGLRLMYTLNEPDAINVGHNNLANHLLRDDGDADEIMAHRLATALISFQMDSGEYPADLAAVAGTLDRLGASTLPDSFETLCARLDRVEGVEFARFFNQIQFKGTDGEAALSAVLVDTHKLAAKG